MKVFFIAFFCLREGLLQEAAGKNQEFQNTSKSLNFFLKNLPDNKISPNDDLSQVNSKQTSQKVSLFVSLKLLAIYLQLYFKTHILQSSLIL